jgi:hypothetical protein
MPTPRSRWLGDPLAAKPVPPRKPDTLEHYSVFWKKREDQTKGTIWLYHSTELKCAGGFNGDEDIDWKLRTYRPSLLKAKGKKWIAIYSDDEHYKFLASPMANKKIMADLVLRWPKPPPKLRLDNGPAFSLHDLQEETHSHVYLVELLTFEPTAAGRLYYKIGKAKSIPHRIKQFGPCEVVASIRLTTEQDSLRVEAELHARFSAYRRPETEIFSFTRGELDQVIAACRGYMEDDEGDES